MEVSAAGLNRSRSRLGMLVKFAVRNGLTTLPGPSTRVHLLMGRMVCRSSLVSKLAHEPHAYRYLRRDFALSCLRRLQYAAGPYG